MDAGAAPGMLPGFGGDDDIAFSQNLFNTIRLETNGFGESSFSGEPGRLDDTYDDGNDSEITQHRTRMLQMILQSLQTPSVGVLVR